MQLCLREISKSEWTVNSARKESKWKLPKQACMPSTLEIHVSWNLQVLSHEKLSLRAVFRLLFGFWFGFRVLKLLCSPTDILKKHIVFPQVNNGWVRSLHYTLFSFLVIPRKRTTNLECCYGNTPTNSAYVSRCIEIGYFVQGSRSCRSEPWANGTDPWPVWYAKMQVALQATSLLIRRIKG